MREEKPIPVLFYPDEIIEESKEERQALSTYHRATHESLIARRHAAIEKLDNFSVMIAGPILSIGLGIAGSTQPALFIVVAIGLLNALFPIIGFLRGNDVLHLDRKVADNQATLAQDEFFMNYKNTPLAMMAEFRFQNVHSFYAFVRKTVFTSTIVNTAVAVIISAVLLQLHETALPSLLLIVLLEILLAATTIALGTRLLTKPERAEEPFPYPMMALRAGQIVHCRVRFHNKPTTVWVRYNFKQHIREMAGSDTALPAPNEPIVMEEWLAVTPKEVKFYPLPEGLHHLERSFNHYSMQLAQRKDTYPCLKNS